MSDFDFRHSALARQLGVHDRWARTTLAIAAAIVYYVLAVGGDISRGGGVLVVGIPCALVFVWWRSRPIVAQVLSASGMVLCVLVSFYQGEGSVTITQWSVGIAILGGTLSDRAIERRFALLLCIAAGMLAAFASGSGVLAVLVGLACALIAAAGWGWRQFARSGTVSVQLRESVDRERDAEREIAVEQERNRVAREVHDIVAHSLAVVIMQADGARYAAKEDPATVEPALESIAETAREALTEVRTLLHELRHSQGKRPTPALIDIDSLVDSMRELGLTVDVAAYGHQRSLGDAAQLAIYRIVQEALTNALRHGETTAPVGVDFDWGDAALTVTITNALRADGVPQIDGPGHGIPGMRERAALAGGELNVGVGNRGMFRVRAVLPVPRIPGPDAIVAPPRPEPADPKHPWSLLTKDEVAETESAATRA